MGTFLNGAADAILVFSIPGWETRGMRPDGRTPRVAPSRRCRRRALGPELILDPLVGPLQSFLEGNLRLPPEHLPQPRVVRIAAANPLRAGNVFLADAHLG